MPNYALDAIRGYQAVDEINRQNRQEAIEQENRKIALEDREDNKQRQAKLDARQDVQWQREDQAEADKQKLRELDAAEVESIFGPDAASNPQAVAKISGMAKDPARSGALIAVHDELAGYLSAGKTPPQDLVIKALNLAGADELQARGGNDGLHRQVESVVPSNVPGEVMIGFNITGKDGKTYKAPMTTGASADPADNVVQSIPVSKLVEWVGGGANTAKALAIARARAGDRSFLDAYHAAKAEQRQAAIRRAEHQAERAEGMADYEQKKLIDQKYQKPEGPVQAGRYGMFYKGKYIANPMTQGLDEGEWETVTDPATGEETRRYTGKGGKETVHYNDDGSFSTYKDGKAMVVYPPHVAERMAREQTDAWAKEHNGVLGMGGASDKEIEDKYQENLRALNGEGAQPEKTAFSPGQTVRQNGKVYVADANGVMQEQGAAPTQTGKKGNGGKGEAEAATTPQAKDYGKRKDGTAKGSGYFGEIKRPDGDVSTELSIGVNFDGKEVEIPTLVPGLNRDQIDSLIKGEKPSKEIVDIAVQHARKRMAGGKSPFAEEGEVSQLPEAKQNPAAVRTTTSDYPDRTPPGEPSMLTETPSPAERLYRFATRNTPEAMLTLSPVARKNKPAAKSKTAAEMEAMAKGIATWPAETARKGLIKTGQVIKDIPHQVERFVGTVADRVELVNIINQYNLGHIDDATYLSRVQKIVGNVDPRQFSTLGLPSPAGK